MKKKTRNILIIAAVASMGFGITGAIPSFMQERLGIAVASSFLVVGGLIMLAIALGD